MKEKELMKSGSYNIRKIINIVIIVIVFIAFAVFSLEVYNRYSKGYYNHWRPTYNNYFSTWIGCLFGQDGTSLSFSIFGIMIIIIVILVIVKMWISNMEITVTDKRVYGKASFGKRVDLPIDSISAVALSPFHGISVSSSSGRIGFKLIVKNNEIYETIISLIIDRQGR
ncbi:MAG: hypothetical protein HDR01_11690 [Lachnospiraceae bacterium]|nr:hypothetical protein [Lachnospiraceae bacterium]